MSDAAIKNRWDADVAEAAGVVVVYEISDEEQARIDDDFTYHAPTEAQIKEYAAIRAQAKALCETLYQLCPQSAERTLAKRKLEEFVFWANASKARHQK